jgi:predicted DNA helicase
LNTHTFVSRYSAYIENERQSELTAFRQQLKHKSGGQLEFLGKALLNMTATRNGEKFGYHYIKCGRNKILKTDMGNGDLVLLSQQHPLKSDLYATVDYVGKNHLILVFDNFPPKWLFKGGIRIDLAVNDTTYKRMIENLKSNFSSSTLHQNILFGKAKLSNHTPSFTTFNAHINSRQKEAIKMILGSNHLSLIHGPPGTGKTTVLIESIHQFATQKQKVLCTADSNGAVDNLLLRLCEEPRTKCLRIGHPSRIHPQLENQSFAYKIERDPEYSKIKTHQERMKIYITQREEFEKPTAGKLRGMSRDRVKTLAKENRSMRGVDGNTIASMAMWIEIDDLIDNERSSLNEVEKNIADKIFAQADVILCTNAMVGSELFKEKIFDVVVIDESSQQMIPSTLIPFVRAPKIIMAGDHKQLQPTVLSNSSALKETLFEKLIALYPKQTLMLTTQYRMNEAIMAFSNRNFYKGELVAHTSVAHKTLPNEKAISFYDASFENAEETRNNESGSYKNEYEINLVEKLVKKYLSMGIDAKEIGVITPYSAQVKALTKLNLGVDVKTVDGFQGGEREVIIISLVRNNANSEIGFVSDERRLNVALTRAKKKLVVIGSQSTFGSCIIYEKLFAYLAKNDFIEGMS